ncbi:hypothetical protein F2Q70_00010764 [Brassica cretica]|uniref:Uncharacterized protein n=1 Tax=Brassica cretica TaxID=69181 RepID=A0A8S9MAI3_BRACR|nr:hypothetical protein F2Q70_00010764 [Brassica cretica]
MFPRTIPSEISEEMPRNSPRKCFFGMSSESLILGIPSEFSEEILLSYEKFSTTILVGLPDDFQEVFRRSLIPCLHFIIELSVLVLIRWFSSSTWICFTDLGLIYMFFRSGSDFGRLMRSLLGSLLKYNARLLGSLLDDFQEVF